MAHGLRLSSWDNDGKFSARFMHNANNIMNNNALAAMARQAAPHVLAAIKRASSATGVSFAYMLQKASAESSFNTSAKSRTSSATGLYQFIEHTWLTLVKRYGDKCGLGKYAACIDDNGHVSNPAVKKQILALRKDPAASAMMAAEFTAENRSYLQDQLGPHAKIGPTELYLAHFLGAGGATEFLKTMKSHSMAQADDLFPQAANANRAVFYDKSGKPRTLAGVYDFFAKKFGGAPVVDEPQTVPAQAPVMIAAQINDSSHKALAQALMDETDSQQAVLNTVIDNAPQASQQIAMTASPHETIHWFTPRQWPMTSTGVGNRLPPSLLADPVHLMILAHAEAPVRPARNANRYNYENLNT
ncbi:MAG TPA: transglycosylase SLT domain-containing protein [Patescibacteria group bacterium]|nr:transglycosylase SLT domain-containing protein [Patescibacteria group bacterium]